jgi:hypothetical protein
MSACWGKEAQERSGRYRPSVPRRVRATKQSHVGGGIGDGATYNRIASLRTTISTKPQPPTNTRPPPLSMNAPHRQHTRPSSGEADEPAARTQKSTSMRWEPVARVTKPRKSPTCRSKAATNRLRVSMRLNAPTDTFSSLTD